MLNEKMEISEEAAEREAEPILDGVTVREFGFGKCSNNVHTFKCFRMFSPHNGSQENCWRTQLHLTALKWAEGSLVT